jgi:CRP-like cAMP-binding protein
MTILKNNLIARLPNTVREAFSAQCVETELTPAAVVYIPGEPTRHVYFPTEGFVSIIASLEGTPGLEVGMVGNEGMVGAQMILGVANSALRAVVQGAGSAWRMPADEFRRQLDASIELRNVLNRYVAVLIAQFATSAVCARYHEVGPRLARWLLMCQDRAQSSDFRMTQEFLAYMLGVRRVSITNAAGVLQQGGLIDYARGAMKVLDRAGLERAACSCYRVDYRGYRELLA